MSGARIMSLVSGSYTYCVRARVTRFMIEVESV